MQRDISQIVNKRYDVAVIGGGIYGACIARDAAMRGLTVLLLERGDFGAETSHNSLKIIHGGIRYLQHLDFSRVISSIKERQAWLRIAPHLVRSIGFLIPTYSKPLRGKIALYLAIKLHEMLALIIRIFQAESTSLPKGCIYTRQQLKDQMPDLLKEGVNGGALWYDVQLVDTNRAIIEMVLQAKQKGADVFNYAEVKEYIMEPSRVAGLLVEDKITSKTVKIGAETVVNANGPWLKDFLALINEKKYSRNAAVYTKGMNLVTRSVGSKYSFGMMSQRLSDSLVDENKRLYFFTPWKGLTIIGTSHEPYIGEPSECQYTRTDVEDFINELNETYPKLKLSKKEILYVYGGLTPAEEEMGSNEIKRSRSAKIIDHELQDGVAGVISVIGVKFTTARGVAEKVVDLLFEKLDRKAVKCETDIQMLPGVADTISSLFDKTDTDALQRIVSYMVDQELAVKLSDVLIRRLDYAARGMLTRRMIETAADAMKEKCFWSDERRDVEVKQLSEELAKHQAIVH